MLIFENFSLISWSMECLWIAPLTPAVMVIRGLTFHPLFCIVLTNGIVFGVFVCEGSWGAHFTVLCANTCVKGLFK